MQTNDKQPIGFLCDLIKSNDGNYFDIDFHRAVYDHIERHVLPTVPSTACPPLSVLKYAVRNILEPTFLTEQIPELLRLLVHLEAMRDNALDGLRTRLRDMHSKGNQPSVDLPESSLRAHRTVYIKVSHACCLLHIHHLWRDCVSAVDPPYTEILMAYYPAFVPNTQAALQVSPVYYNLATKEELAENRREGINAANFLVAATQYIENSKVYCNEHGHRIDESFDDIFPPPDTGVIAEAIMRFVKSVQSVVDSLENVTTE